MLHIFFGFVDIPFVYSAKIARGVSVEETSIYFKLS